MKKLKMVLECAQSANIVEFSKKIQADILAANQEVVQIKTPHQPKPTAN